MLVGVDQKGVCLTRRKNQVHAAVEGVDTHSRCFASKSFATKLPVVVAVPVGMVSGGVVLVSLQWTCGSSQGLSFCRAGN